MTCDPHEVRKLLVAALQRRRDAVRSGSPGQGPCARGTPGEVAGALVRSGRTSWCQVLGPQKVSAPVRLGELGRWPEHSVVFAVDGSWVAQGSGEYAEVWSTR